MISYESAIEKIKAVSLSIAGAENAKFDELPLLECDQRILSEDLVAKISSPPFTNSAMDGFAFDYEEAISSKSLLIGETIFAKPIDSLPERKKGQCVRIMTGAQAPKWADTVIPVENCQVFEKDGETRVEFLDLPKKGSHLRIEAEDVKMGSVVLKKGSFLDPERIMVAASFGYSELKVVKRPVVGIFTTGDELLIPGEPLKAGTIYNSSRYFLESAFAKIGVPAKKNTLLRDNPKLAKEEIEKFLKSSTKDSPSIVVTTGAVSAGEKDFIPQLAKEMGFEPVFHKVAIKPGKPIFLAKMGDSFWIGLAGNAVSTMVGFHFFLKPLLDACNILPNSAEIEVEIDEDFEKPAHLKCFFRARISNNKAHLYKNQGSARVEASAHANAYVVLPEGISKVLAGTKIKAKLI